MDLAAILRSRIGSVTDGSHLPGLKAVLQHVEVAIRHLERGKETADDAAFTDAIYRTNQAFEGSLKEAYRVLAGKDPNKISTHNIETYLQQNNTLRPRVLAQLTNYRTEWRNPAAHDYRLDFDEDEALLAIVTVSVFAIVLLDQIIERLSFERAKATTPHQSASTNSDQTLIERVANLIDEFTAEFAQNQIFNAHVTESQIIGALGGYLSARSSDLVTRTEALYGSARADLVIDSATDKLVIEIKQFRNGQHENRRIRNAVDQVEHLMKLSNISNGIVYFLDPPITGGLIRQNVPLSYDGFRTIVLITKSIPNTGADEGKSA